MDLLESQIEEARFRRCSRRWCKPLELASFENPNHKPAVDIAAMKTLATTSAARSSLRLQTWSVFLSKYTGRISVHYLRGEAVGCPDALSRLRIKLSDETLKKQAWAEKFGRNRT